MMRIAREKLPVVPTHTLDIITLGKGANLMSVFKNH